MSVSQVQARIAQLQARFDMAPRQPVPSFDGVLRQAESFAMSGAATSPTSGLRMGTALAPAPNEAWVRSLPDQGKAWAGEITAAADRHGVDPRLLAGLVMQESAFRADAVSPAGARGLAQLMPGTAAALGVDPDDPVQNLDGGAAYLREQLDRFGRVDLALAAYNAGPTRVADAGGIPNITETQAYVAKVLANYDRLSQAGS